MSLSFPGKTFLVGEYSVLDGSEALVIATNPLFQSAENENQEYHPESAVGRFCEQHHFQFTNKILNPYQMGGFGQSTAEFLFCWKAFQNSKSVSNQKIPKKEFLSRALSDYFKCYLKTPTETPSGADLVCLVESGITYVKKNRTESESLSWPFTDLSFFIVSTGIKIKTHEHLNQLDRKKIRDLNPASQKVIQSFHAKNENDFLVSLKFWQKKLTELYLQADDVIKLKENLESNRKILLVKPCGAMGADVVLVFFRKENYEEVKKVINDKNLKIQASEKDIYYRGEHELG